MRLAKHRMHDHISAAILFRYCFFWIAWATLRNDWWRDSNGREVKFGIIHHEGTVSAGKALAILRLKIGFAWRK